MVTWQPGQQGAGSCVALAACPSEKPVRKLLGVPVVRRHLYVSGTSGRSPRAVSELPQVSGHFSGHRRERRREGTSFAAGVMPRAWALESRAHLPAAPCLSAARPWGSDRCGEPLPQLGDADGRTALVGLFFFILFYEKFQPHSAIQRLHSDCAHTCRPQRACWHTCLVTSFRLLMCCFEDYSN